jgi:hypothetical protein
LQTTVKTNYQYYEYDNTGNVNPNWQTGVCKTAFTENLSKSSILRNADISVFLIIIYCISAVRAAVFKLFGVTGAAAFWASY